MLEDQAYEGLPCVARSTEDDRFYRSKILTIVDQVAKVLFVDYGKVQETPISQLRRMVPRFMQYPQLVSATLSFFTIRFSTTLTLHYFKTWHSKLKGVIKKTFGPANPDPQKHIAACFLTEKTISALFHSTTSGKNLRTIIYLSVSKY